MNKLAVLEGLLFIVGDEGITLDKICDVLEKSNLLFDYKEVCSNEKSEVTSAIDFILSDNIEVFCDFQKHSAMELRLDRCNSGPCIIM